MLVLMMLVTLTNGAEAWEIMDDAEFSSETFIFELGPEIYDYTIVFSTKRRSLGLYVRDIPGSFEHDKIFICLAYVYLMLSPIEFIGLILLTLLLFILILVTLSKNKRTKQSEDSFVS